MTAWRAFELRGLDGANPLGFLAAVGTLVVAVRSGQGAARLRWKREYRWLPVLEGVTCPDEASLCRILAATLRERAVSGGDQDQLAAAQKTMEIAKTAIKRKKEELRRRKLKGTDRTEAHERELRPLLEQLRRARENWIEARALGAGRPELALGKRVEDATGGEYRELARRLLAASGPSGRDALDHLAALGSDACVDGQGQLEPTPFEFTRGSGHQFLLEDVRKLIGYVTPERVGETLLRPWGYRDPGLSMRWDPVEDRRYALLDRDPSDEGARTVWMGNLLAYHGLALFPTAPGTGRLLATGWLEENGRLAFTWPLWEAAANCDMVRSLLGLAELVRPRPDAAVLRARGIAAVYRAGRVEVGRGSNRKINFSPARALC